MFISFWTAYSVFSFLAFMFLVAIVVTHIISRIKRAKPLNLTPDSIVVIIGACTGIGRVMAIEIAKNYKSTIIIVDKRKDLFQEMDHEIKKFNSICECLLCDLSDPKSVDKLIETIKDQRSRIDFLIYNAGITVPELTWETSEDQLQGLMNVNFFSPIKIINGLFSRLIGGHVAVVASTVSILDGGTPIIIQESKWELTAPPNMQSSDT